jgi:hypothetical protein
VGSLERKKDIHNVARKRLKQENLRRMPGARWSFLFNGPQSRTLSQQAIFLEALFEERPFIADEKAEAPGQLLSLKITLTLCNISIARR